MEYVYLQPKYVSEFKCDGKICPKNCCRRNWKISIDEETYEKYLRLESEEHELTRNIFSDGGEFFIKQDGGACPFLNSDGLCSIQLERGEENISQVCRSYPRQLYRFGAMIERSLTLTCPLAARLVLNPNLRIEFETAQIDLPEWANRQIFVSESNVPPEISNHFVEIQLTAISILQQRALTIDGRLIVLGFYLRQLEEFIRRGDFGTIATLNKIYTSEEFFLGQVPILIDSVKFQKKEFVPLISSVVDKIRDGAAQKYLRQINFDIAAKVRKKFFKKYSMTLENYLVNEFFGGVYPYKIKSTIQHNYAVFSVNFKILEVTALSLYAKNSERKIFEMISELAVDLNHNENFLSAITDAVKDFADITILMKKIFCNLKII
ncbi:MAG: flagellin lysine-N-methylase [Selenomonadaceae bacterium]|nr:flagellin lysine-N-methylase [Selenomonadaceae bacterium]